ncbi:MAG TPA: hypothetical protein VGX25_12455, partial [Actinophytocola sp.]|uniref:hypothetical protein n=1 Tax=Actinophytocola sp. TaxID=1872138 RepID=UPI002DDCCE35
HSDRFNPSPPGGRPPEAQLYRFVRSSSVRNLRYAHLLVEAAVARDTLPRPYNPPTVKPRPRSRESAEVSITTTCSQPRRDLRRPVARELAQLVRVTRMVITCTVDAPRLTMTPM